MAPIISVVMSVFNEESDLKGSIESILNQTFSDFEFIIVNDGSIDSTQEILEHYARRDKRVKIIVNQENMGLARSLNKGIRNASGKYIARMDADDISDATRFEKQVKFLEENDDVYIVGTQGYITNEDGEIIGKREQATTPDAVKNNLFNRCGIIHPSIMARKELFEKIGTYDIKYDLSLEVELAMRTIRYGFKIANLPGFLVYSKSRRKGMTLSNMMATQRNQTRIRMKYLPYFFNLKNISYTARSFCGCLLPPFLRRSLDAHVRKRSQKGERLDKDRS